MYASGSSWSGQIALTGQAGSYIYRFRYDPAKTDLVYKVIGTSDPDVWPHAIFSSDSDPIPPLDNGWLSLAVPAFLGAGPDPAPRMFLRMEVTVRP